MYTDELNLLKHINTVCVSVCVCVSTEQKRHKQRAEHKYHLIMS